jgi:predicted dinucleotide-utilizing enzyme|tara:strand:- start:985 stop:1224 length:240 start_codon:yes stop_codon:yes gene_type:complete
MFIQKRTAFIEKELMEDLEERFKRLEGIIIELISQQKKIQIEQKGLERSYKALVEIVASLSKEGLREKILRIQESNKDN